MKMLLLSTTVGMNSVGAPPSAGGIMLRPCPTPRVTVMTRASINVSSLNHAVAAAANPPSGFRQLFSPKSQEGHPIDARLTQGLPEHYLRALVPGPSLTWRGCV